MRPPIRLAILDCDTPTPATIAKYGGRCGAIFEALMISGALAEGLNGALDISAYHVENSIGNYPVLSDVDALLLTGSRHDSFTDAPWILKLVEYCTEALQSERVRLIGVCFGHQIIARAMGMQVGRNPQGWELAVINVQLTARGQDIFRSKQLRIYQSHRDIVHAYPDGVEALGSSVVCNVQGMYAPRRLLTLQGHPELTATVMREIVEECHKIYLFEENIYADYRRKVDLPHDGAIVGSAFVRFLLEQ